VRTNRAQEIALSNSATGANCQWGTMASTMHLIQSRIPDVSATCVVVRGPPAAAEFRLERKHRLLEFITLSDRKVSLICPQPSKAPRN